METENFKPNFLRQRILGPCLFLKTMVLIIIGFSIYSCASLHSSNEKARLRAVKKITDQNILYNIILGKGYPRDFYMEMEALKMITDQNLINKIAFECKESLYRSIATDKITDQNILVKIALEDLDYLVRSKARNKIRDQNIIYKVLLEVNDFDFFSWGQLLVFISDQNLIIKLAKESKSKEVRIAAVKKITDQNILFKMALEDTELNLAALSGISDQNLIKKIAIESTDVWARKVAVDKITDQNFLLKIFLEENSLNVKLAAKEGITDQNLLMNISQKKNFQMDGFFDSSNDFYYLPKIAFNKLNDNLLDILTREAKDSALALSAKIRLGQVTWDEVFLKKNNSTISLSDFIKASAFVDTPEPASSDVVSACRNFIEYGYPSMNNELIILLFKFGDVGLAYDYLNCGNPYLENAGGEWGRKHGYYVRQSVGSNRIIWGSKK